MKVKVGVADLEWTKVNSNTGFPYNQLSEAAKSAIDTEESGSPSFLIFLPDALSCLLLWYS